MDLDKRIIDVTGQDTKRFIKKIGVRNSPALNAYRLTELYLKNKIVNIMNILLQVVYFGWKSFFDKKLEGFDESY